MRYKEISLNGLGKVTAKDIVNELMREVELLYDKDCVELIVGVPDVDIDFTLYNKYGYETLEIDLIFDRYGRTFCINTENIGDTDFVEDFVNNVNELFIIELKKLNELYKK